VTAASVPVRTRGAANFPAGRKEPG
jgi:hypothetical protein